MWCFCVWLSKYIWKKYIIKIISKRITLLTCNFVFSAFHLTHETDDVISKKNIINQGKGWKWLVPNFWLNDERCFHSRAYNKQLTMQGRHTYAWLLLLMTDRSIIWRVLKGPLHLSWSDLERSKTRWHIHQPFVSQKGVQLRRCISLMNTTMLHKGVQLCC